MKLYGSGTSPFVRHCRMALIQTNLDYEYVETDFAASAEKSPTAKVPFLADGDLQLTDSGSILKYIREKSGGRFLPELDDFENFTMANTMLDSAINVFLLERENFGPSDINYIKRQNARIQSGLVALNARMADPDLRRDGTLRCACFVDWAVFRKRVDLAPHQNLQNLLDSAQGLEEFVATSPSLAG